MPYWHSIRYHFRFCFGSFSPIFECHSIFLFFFFLLFFVGRRLFRKWFMCFLDLFSVFISSSNLFCSHVFTIFHRKPPEYSWIWSWNFWLWFQLRISVALLSQINVDIENQHCALNVFNPNPFFVLFQANKKFSYWIYVWINIWRARQNINL